MLKFKTVPTISTAALLLLVSGMAAAKTTITIAHSWDANNYIHKEISDAVKLYQKVEPNVQVKIMTGTSWDKILTMSAGGVAPDLYVLAGPSVIPAYLQGMIQPVTEYIKKAGVKESDFVTPAWNATEWEGTILGLPAQADPNFGFFWNKNIFASVGLNPDDPPKTIQEMDAIGKKLTQFDGSKLKRVGMVPWSIYGNNNSFFTWGWAFGGEFYDARNKKITANDPKLVNALKWMQSYVKTYPYAAYSNIQAGATGYMNQKQAMALLTVGDATSKIPKDFKWGISAVPYDAVSGAENPTWVGGFSWVVPRGSKRKNEAFDFMKFALGTVAGTEAMKNSMPSYRKASVFDELKNDPIRGPFATILQKARNVRPVTPVTNEYRVALDTVVNDVIYKGTKSPEAALDAVTTSVQTLLARALSRRRDK